MSKNTQTKNWEWCQAAHFSPESNYIMVSGVFSRAQPYMGELAVFAITENEPEYETESSHQPNPQSHPHHNLQESYLQTLRHHEIIKQQKFNLNLNHSAPDKKFNFFKFSLISRIQIKPHDVFGCWFGNEHVISCKTQWHGGYPLISEVYLNKTNPDVTDPTSGVVESIFKFANKNWSVIRMLNTIKITQQADSNLQPLRAGNYLVAAKGSRVWTPHELGFKKLKSDHIPKIPYKGISISNSYGNNSHAGSSSNSTRNQINAATANNTNDNAQPNPNSVWAEILNDSTTSNQVHNSLELDKWDKEIVFEGQIIGFEVLESTQKILINVRDWLLSPDQKLDNTQPFDPANPPQLSKFPRLLIFDIPTWSIQRELAGHEALSPANRCCFLMPSASGELAACGDETGKVYIWEYKTSRGSLIPGGPLYHQGNVINNGRHLKNYENKTELRFGGCEMCMSKKSRE